MHVIEYMIINYWEKMWDILGILVIEIVWRNKEEKYAIEQYRYIFWYMELKAKYVIDYEQIRYIIEYWIKQRRKQYDRCLRWVDL